MLAFGTLLEKQMHAAAARRAAPCPSTISWRKQKKTSKRGTVFLYIYICSFDGPECDEGPLLMMVLGGGWVFLDLIWGGG